MASENLEPRLENLLEDCATSNSGLVLYDSLTSEPQLLSYFDLHHQALFKSTLLRRRYGNFGRFIVLIHFHRHYDNIVWFWATIIAGLVPAMSTPFVKSREGRLSHLRHLKQLLLNPLVVTAEALVATEFEGDTSLRIATAEMLEKQDEATDMPNTSNSTVKALGPRVTSKVMVESNDPVSLAKVAALMLTSGSTGSAKAVCLTHEQILTACKGKLAHLPMPEESTCLNWIGLDHVGSLVELHLTAMLADCSQVHVPARDMIAEPLAFLRLLSKHKVTRTFAPNFFLSKAPASPEICSAVRNRWNQPHASALPYLRWRAQRYRDMHHRVRTSTSNGRLLGNCDYTRLRHDRNLRRIHLQSGVPKD